MAPGVPSRMNDIPMLFGKTFPGSNKLLGLSAQEIYWDVRWFVSLTVMGVMVLVVLITCFMMIRYRYKQEGYQRI
ncbi:hypothetical protein QR680_017941 [Steinernema hermaphroditum]|uniref:Uncharacterized protein n=1 Tax=Steinernema hermaphroditum TaxID=289476 RepID=A0AA39HHM8_9BILA|nr:hypothetical protein QR680_017941 [Steinernema hermaphroditum]